MTRLALSLQQPVLVESLRQLATGWVQQLETLVVAEERARLGYVSIFVYGCGTEVSGHQH